MIIQNETGKGRIPSLDGLRTISIFLVILYHASATNGFPLWAASWLDKYPLGPLGVRVFFVISGFLITTLLLNEERVRRSISLASFYKRRALRILPAYYFYILALMGIGLFLPFLKVPLSSSLSAATFTTCLWGYWDAGKMGTSWLLSHSWSLSVEEQFYILWPAALLFFRSTSWRMGFAICVMILVPVFRAAFVHYNWGLDKALVTHLFLTQADPVMWGCLLSLVFEKKKSLAERIFRFRPFFFRIAVLAPIVGCSFFRPGFFIVLSPTVESCVCAYLIGSLVLIREGLAYRLLNLSALRWIGGLSYSLYVWQQLFLVPRNAFVGLWFQRFPQNIIGVALLGLGSWSLIEKPFLKLKARFTRLKTPVDFSLVGKAPFSASAASPLGE